MFDRMYRDIPASPPKAASSTGSARWRARSASFPAGPSESYSREEIPEMGSHPSFTPKRIISSRASQKVGMANPVNTVTVEIRSKRDPLRTAE